MQILVTLAVFLLSFLNFNTADAKVCVFCRQNVVEHQQVYSTQYFNVLIDYEPRVEGHLLVIPKRHMAKAHELLPEEWEELSLIIPKIAKVFATHLYADDYIILEKNGPNAFQQVPHVHFHLFPVTTQKWGEIFDIVPDEMSKDDLKEEVTRFRSYFSE
jgi:diadenosine tetraphosphate (Ap4A) HIT family hydrolase